MAPTDPLHGPLQAAIADELRQVRLRLESLAEVLVGDAHFVATYIDHLQTFDWLGQCADEAAALLDRIADGVPAHDAVEPVRLGVVQGRLREALTLAQAA